jgi:hypothetical protein
MRRKLRHSGMPRQRAAKFPPKIRSQFLEWDVRVIEGNVFITIKPPDGRSVQMRLDPDDAFEFGDAVHRGVDQAVGI